MLRKAKSGQPVDANFILQESGITIEFITKVLPRLDSEGINVNVYHVSSAELFDLLPKEEKEKIYPDSLANEIMGITGFTLATMYRWVTSSEGRSKILHPFKKGHYLGSGNAESVMKEAGLDGENMYKEVKSYIDYLTKKKH